MMKRHPRSTTIVSQLPSLALRLRDETRDLHRTAERSGVMSALLRGHIDRPAYVALIANLHALYEALEKALTRHAARIDFAPFEFAALRRAHALAADLQALAEAAPPLQLVTLAYVERLHALAEEAPQRLIAHAYVRYLGDLNGGQVLQRIVERALALDARATSFYDFGPPARLAALATGFRQALDALKLDGTASQAVVDEARWSFTQHVSLFEALA